MSERTHVASKPDAIVLREVDVCGGDPKARAYKPFGFWYEVNGDWRRWCRAEDFHSTETSYLHAVELRDCNVLVLDSLQKLDAFNASYGREARFGREIAWQALAVEYDGLEIAPYQWERRLAKDFHWYYGWDCASGVIWRPRNVVVTYIGPSCPQERRNR